MYKLLLTRTEPETCGLNIVVIFMIILLALVLKHIIVRLHCHIENLSIEDMLNIIYLFLGCELFWSRLAGNSFCYICFKTLYFNI